MYELINTSVPNGLIAGTHGFATVAMTKGMPDVIRQRVENFCAYPHRTSAHDASYYLENPVNWFHLVLPGGDHVVGRTAPAEFDYTGRTNRISRTLHFSSREMPLNGGAYVLTAESVRFSEGWNGDPRYLPVDKVACGRLQMAARPNGGNPRHWVEMFGGDGILYARKFAQLLAQNIRNNKGIYFKASSADADGRRLLGLFSDLINLLPEELAPQATFSTFSPCVPNGVACHLRGIYDKDRAFELASALQPWVDCDSATVKHSELLPAGIDEGAAKEIPQRRQEPDVAQATLAQQVRPREDSRDRAVRYLKDRSAKVNDEKFPWWKIVVVAMAFIVTAVALCCFILKDDIKRALSGDDRNSSVTKSQIADQLASWRDGVIRDLNGLNGQIDGLKTSADAKKLLPAVKRRVDEWRSSYEWKLLAENDRSGLGGSFDALLGKMSGKMEELDKVEKRRLEEERKRKEKELEDKKRAEADKKTKKDEQELIDRQKQSEEAAKKQAEIENRPLSDLDITEVVPHSKRWIERLPDADKSSLTNESSIIYFYLENGQVKREPSRLKPRARLGGSSNKRVAFDAIAPAGKDMKWLVVYIPGLQRVYWQWRKIETVMFASGDSINLGELVFGGDNEAMCLYKKSQDYIWVISFSGVDGNYRHFYSKDELPIERYKRNQEKMALKVDNLKLSIQGMKTAITNANAVIAKLDESRDRMKKFLNIHNNLEGKKKDLDKDKGATKELKASAKNDKRKTREDIESNEKSALGEFVKFEKFNSKIKTNGKKEKYIDLSQVKENDIDDAVNDRKEQLIQEINRHRRDIEDSEKKIKEMEAGKDDWRCFVRKLLFEIEVIGAADLPEKAKGKFKESHHVDYLKRPTGIGEE